MNTMKTLAAIALLAGPLPLPARAAAQEGPPSITVHGEGTIEVDPDRASVRLGVESQAATAREAQAETNRIAAAILAAVRDLGVPEEAIRTSRLDLFPVYAPPAERGDEPQVTGYRAANTVTVELADLTRVGPVIDASIAAGANRVDGVEFGLRDTARARAEALAAAVDDAHGKAVAIAAALGVGLGGVLETVEGGVSAPPVPMFERMQASVVQEAPTPVSTGRVRVTASLTVRYGIDQP